jgi:polyhydroxyalkanoate depolymerase
LAPFRAAADLARTAFSDTHAGPAANYWMRCAAAGAEIFARARMTHERPAYGITPVMVAGNPTEVHEEIALNLPFGNLVHFRKAGVVQPRVLLAAPMAGHFSTLLRGTVQTMLADHDVYITDWKSARDVPLSEGRFGTDEYIDHLIAFLDHVGEGVHAIAVCQPCPSMLAAAALMAEDNHPATPRSLTLMAGPVDTRISPTRVNTLANEHPLEWFADNLITSVPRRYPGAFRHVYPGFLQLSAFVTMNLARHVRAHMDLFGHLLKGELEKADVNRRFYDEYFSVADLAAEFYLETVQKIFQEHHLARGIYAYRGRRVNPSAIHAASLLTVEGERDDICGLGQTMAAHELCSGIKPFRKKHYVQPGVGHYGVFSGSRWQTQIYPMVRSAILAAE